MRPIHQIFILLTLALLSLSCQPSSQQRSSGKKQIHTPLFLYYDFASQIVGDLAQVSLIVPPGVSLHDYEPSPRDMMLLQNSDLLIFTSKATVPWVSHLLKNSKGQALQALNISEALQLDMEDDHTHSHHDGHNHASSSGDDPHIWMNPTLILPIFDAITSRIIKMDPINAPIYTTNAAAYRKQLEESLQAMTTTITSSVFTPLLFAGGFSHRLFLEHHNLVWFSVYVSDHLENDPSIQRMARAKAFIQLYQLRTLFVDPLLTTKIAQTLATEFDLTILPFHTAHSVTKEQLEAKVSYIQLMEENRQNLHQALNNL